MAERRPGRPGRVAGIFVRLVGDDDDAAWRPRPPPGAAICGDRQAAVERLAAGHRDRVVVEDLVGDVDAGRDRGADGEAAGVVVGAVAEVLEDVAAGRERRLADPVGALAAHLGVALGRAVHELRHVVAADAGIGARAFGHDGRGVVRAAGAEVGRAARRCRGSRASTASRRLAGARRCFASRSSGDPLRACARRWRWRSRWCRARPSPGTASRRVSSFLPTIDRLRWRCRRGFP